MPTTNILITPEATKIVAAGDEFLLTLDTRPLVRLATVAQGGAAPTVRGHRLNPAMGESLNRALLGPGDVWAWSDDLESSTAATLTTWTP